MFRSFLVLALIVLPASASACFSCCKTYDLAHPGVFNFKFSPVDNYVLGRIIKIDDKEPLASEAYVTIEVLEDYRFPEGGRYVQALATVDGSCTPRASLGQYAKFGITRKDGKPRLVSTSVNVF